MRLFPRLRRLRTGKVTVLLLGGTWNPRGDAIGAAFAEHLDTARFVTRIVEYPADYGRSVPYADSVAAGEAALIAAIRSTPGDLILAGYSQGAAVAGNVAGAIGRNDLDCPAVLACALIADPLRPQGMAVGPDPGGYGIAGQRPVPRIPTFWAAAPGDPITALPAGNPLRTVADLSGYFSLSSTRAAWRWGRSLLDAATHRQLQRWWSPEHRRSWAGAAAYARGYLIDGRHTSDYLRDGHVARLAERLGTELDTLRTERRA
ncbi:PE-PPE domain-containing protein [Nocardia sp. NPDC050697]|uniref:PE-PPE domain-containing protein n=1 Tax=Nocardia sp. NPDC050697 TaxID=3155158 RepID=UPI0033E32768